MKELNRVGWRSLGYGRLTHLWHKKPDGNIALSLCGLVRKEEKLLPEHDYPRCDKCCRTAMFASIASYRKSDK